MPVFPHSFADSSFLPAFPSLTFSPPLCSFLSPVCALQLFFFFPARASPNVLAAVWWKRTHTKVGSCCQATLCLGQFPFIFLFSFIFFSFELPCWISLFWHHHKIRAAFCFFVFFTSSESHGVFFLLPTFHSEVKMPPIKTKEWTGDVPERLARTMGDQIQEEVGWNTDDRDSRVKKGKRLIYYFVNVDTGKHRLGISSCCGP